MILVSMQSYGKRIQKIDDVEIHYEIPIGKYLTKIGKIGKNGDFFVGVQNLKFFYILFFEHLCIIIMSVVSKFERK